MSSSGSGMEVPSVSLFDRCEHWPLGNPKQKLSTGIQGRGGQTTQTDSGLKVCLLWKLMFLLPIQMCCTEEAQPTVPVAVM